MEPRLIEFDKEARRKIALGADKLARAVIATLGPQSHNVAIHRKNFMPLILHDGVSVAREIRFKDQYEDMGAMLIRQAAQQTNDLAGDGTTTATLLANTLLQEGLKLLDGEDDVLSLVNKGVNAMDLQRAILLFSEILQEELEGMKKVIENQEELRQIATISAANKELGEMIADGWNDIGINGQVIVDINPNVKDELSIGKGYTFDNGFMNVYFMTNPNKYIAEYKDAYILFADYNISTYTQISGILTKVFRNGLDKALIIIASDITGGAMEALIKLKMNEKTNYPICVIQAPEWGERRLQVLEDMALLTGGVVLNPVTAKIEEAEIQHLGKVKDILVTQQETTFIPDNTDEDELAERIETIKNQIESEKTEWIQDKLRERLARLSQSIAIIKLTSGSPAEFGDKRERVIDAVFATKAAMEDGIVAGGGVTLMQLSRTMGGEKAAGIMPEAFDLVQRTLRRPFEVLLKNSGIDIEQVEGTIDWEKKTEGYNVVTRKVVDMYQDGIVDPVKVTKLAIRHAFSVAATILTIAAAITDDKTEDGKHIV